ncbi:MAG: N-acetylneuraminate synthase family protein [Ktedonobacteraceae bacterium]|nr:N-acetylneuraminate synthase family protein [Ktedonobacteraceae bacterium]
MRKTLKLGGFEVGSNCPPYVIAEVGSNHNGDMALCRQLIDAAADAGANAVKFQSWTESSLIAEEEYVSNVEYADKKRHFGSLRDMVKAYQLTTEQHYEAETYCRKRGIAFCSTPFSADEVDLLDKLKVPFFKIASMDVGHLELLKHVARKQRPIVLSTGMATISEIERAVLTMRAEGNDQIALLHCISIYPPDYETINLRNIEMLSKTFDVTVGFSDHTMGIAIPLAAIALGASIIEKHFTLDQEMAGWDHAISATPEQLSAIVTEGRNIVTALGSYPRIVSPAEIEKRRKFRRSLVAEQALPTGHTLSSQDLGAKRPGTGIAPEEQRYVIGRKLSRPIKADQVIRWDDLS